METSTLETLDTQAIYAGLEEAWIIFDQAKKQTCHGPQAIYSLIYSAQRHIDKQVKELLAPPE